MIFLLVAGLSLCLFPRISALGYGYGEKTTTVDVYVGYFGTTFVNIGTVTEEEMLENCEYGEWTYSSIDNGNYTRYNLAEGVTMTSLMDYLGIATGDIDEIYFLGTDNDYYAGFYNLFGVNHWYYPYLAQNWDQENPSESNRAVIESKRDWVPAILAFRQSLARDTGAFDYDSYKARMNDDNCLRIVFGQTTWDEVSTSDSVKWVYEMAVSLRGSPITTSNWEAEIGSSQALEGYYQVNSGYEALDEKIKSGLQITSSDPTVVQVDKNGNLTAVGEGTATIYIVYMDDEYGDTGAFSDRITVTVKGGDNTEVPENPGTGSEDEPVPDPPDGKGDPDPVPDDDDDEPEPTPEDPESTPPTTMTPDDDSDLVPPEDDDQRPEDDDQRPEDDDQEPQEDDDQEPQEDDDQEPQEDDDSRGDGGTSGFEGEESGSDSDSEGEGSGDETTGVLGPDSGIDTPSRQDGDEDGDSDGNGGAEAEGGAEEEGGKAGEDLGAGDPTLEDPGAAERIQEGMKAGEENVPLSAEGETVYDQAKGYMEEQLEGMKEVPSTDQITSFTEELRRTIEDLIEQAEEEDEPLDLEEILEMVEAYIDEMVEEAEEVAAEETAEEEVITELSEEESSEEEDSEEDSTKGVYLSVGNTTGGDSSGGVTTSSDNMSSGNTAGGSGGKVLEIEPLPLYYTVLLITAMAVMFAGGGLYRFLRFRRETAER